MKAPSLPLVIGLVAGVLLTLFVVEQVFVYRMAAKGARGADDFYEVLRANQASQASAKSAGKN